MLSLLQWLNRPWEPLYILSLLRSPLFGVTVEGFLTIDQCLEEEISLASYIYEGLFLQDESLDEPLKSALTKLKEFYESWVPYTPQKSMNAYLYDLFTASGLKAMLLLQRNNIQLIKNVEKLIDVLAQFKTSSLDELLKQIKQLAVLSDKEGEAEVELAEGNMVHIMTVHASKGLEFPIVFLPDLAKGPRGDTGSIRFDKDVRLAVQYKKEIDLLKKPVEKSSPAFNAIKARSKDQAVEEAKRLFYVAVTRAKDYLVLSTVAKAANDSWYDMLLNAMEDNGFLQTYIEECLEVPEYEKWEDSGEEYQAPVLNEENLNQMSFSVSEIMTFINDPLKYFDKYIVKIEDHWLEEKTNQVQTGDNYDIVSGATLGTIVHRACELFDHGYELDEAKAEALAIIDDEIEKSRFEQAMEGLMNNYRQLEELNLGKAVENEWPFTVEIEGVQIIGEIDKIVEKNGLFHLIDLKTNKSKDLDKLTDYYSPQLYLYKMAFEKEYQQKVDCLSLFFMRAGKAGFRSVAFHPDVEKEMSEVIKAMANLKQNDAGKSEYINYYKKSKK
ncbi:PD-(D/E)XK nuclease family protein [Anaerobacillus sp. CMMVII]|uniref:3'-5' exonuclease n=1 Tax=Anaerobacillus sp. CMMVII TaxID=2755588 RepID=UPI0021B72704|nr:3'-5' exonuclease [Anaerobacillus sp. CMMVII]MCT8137537.1 PD-(D/E)XK nuclease family protein [Anaerobacillus sp. CMMVII]